jgi:hypothetical protein
MLQGLVGNRPHAVTATAPRHPPSRPQAQRTWKRDSLRSHGCSRSRKGRAKGLAPMAWRAGGGGGEGGGVEADGADEAGPRAS